MTSNLIDKSKIINKISHSTMSLMLFYFLNKLNQNLKTQSFLFVIYTKLQESLIFLRQVAIFQKSTKPSSQNHLLPLLQCSNQFYLLLFHNLLCLEDNFHTHFSHILQRLHSNSWSHSHHFSCILQNFFKSRERKERTEQREQPLQSLSRNLFQFLSVIFKLEFQTNNVQDKPKKYFYLQQFDWAKKLQLFCLKILSLFQKHFKNIDVGQQIFKRRLKMNNLKHKLDANIFQSICHTLMEYKFTKLNTISHIHISQIRYLSTTSFSFLPNHHFTFNIQGYYFLTFINFRLFKPCIFKNITHLQPKETNKIWNYLQ